MQKRKMRFSPDENNIVELKSGDTVVRGLIRDESFDGLGIVACQTFSLKVGDTVEMKIVDGAFFGRGEVMRIEEFDDVLVKVGVSISL